MLTGAVLIVVHFINGTSTLLDEMMAASTDLLCCTDELEEDRPNVDASTPIFFVQNVQKQDNLQMRSNESYQCWGEDVTSLSLNISGGGQRACHATTKSKHDFFTTVLPLKPPNCWMPQPTTGPTQTCPR